MGTVFLLHITAVAFIIGVAMMAPLAELAGMRTGGERWERFAHSIATVVERLFAWGATWAAFALVAIYGLYPRLWGYLSSLFLVPLIVVGAVFWFVMTVTAYGYYITWEPLRNRKLLHNAIGWTFVIFTMLFITTITSLSSFLLTPAGGPDQLLAAAINPSYIPEVIHRHIGNLSYGGLLLAGYIGGWFLLFRRGRGQAESDRTYRAWMGDVALIVGMAVILAQPVVGWFYASSIRAASPEAFQRMMVGENAWMFLLQIGLLGAVFFFGNLYLASMMSAPGDRGRTRGWIRASVWVIVALTLLGLIPKEFPLGQMYPWKYIVLAGFVLVTAVNLIVYLRARRQLELGRAGGVGRVALAGLAVAIVALFMLMGTIRASARGDDLIYKRLGPGVGQELQRP